MPAHTAEPSGTTRSLLQDLYVTALVRSLYGVYVERLRDAAGRSLIETYLRAEGDRARRIERWLADRGSAPAAAVLSLFSGLGTLYGRATSCLGTRVMLRIALSASRRAARRACAALGADAPPDLVFFAMQRARNEGDLLDSLRQHLIDTRRRRS